MPGSLLESLTGLISPQMTDSIASRLGESEGAVRQGLLGGAASLLSGIAGRASDSGFIGQIFNMATSSETEAAAVPSQVSALASGAGGTGMAELGTKLLGLVFGSRQSSVSEAIGRASGLSTSSAASILSMAAPLVLGLLGQRARSQNLAPASMASMLTAEAPSLQRFVPAGLGNILGGLQAVAAPVVAGAASAASGTRWLWPVLALLLVGIGVLWYSTRGGRRATEIAQNTADRSVAVASNAAGALGDFLKRSLPTGLVLNVPRYGIENRLVDFIGDPNRPVDTTTWFDFDRLLFDTGSATLQPASREQLENVANIMKAYPRVKAKIGGYTDNTGDPAANQKLSSDRANSVMNELVQLGVGGERLSAEGYGSANPVADNSTEEGRARNRRISLRVVEK